MGFLGWAFSGGAYFAGLPGSNPGGVGTTLFIGSAIAYFGIFSGNVGGQLLSVLIFAAGFGLIVYGYNSYLALFDSKDNKEGAGALLRFKTDEVMAKARKQKWRTPLHIAVEAGYDDVAAVLLSYSIVVDAQDKHGYAALHLAAEGGNPRLVKLLLDHDADVNVRSKIGETPLFRAVYCGDRNIVELLIDYGADVNAKSNTDWTPLHSAARSGRKDLVALLLAVSVPSDAVGAAPTA